MATPGEPMSTRDELAASRAALAARRRPAATCRRPETTSRVTNWLAPEECSGGNTFAAIVNAGPPAVSRREDRVALDWRGTNLYQRECRHGSRARVPLRGAAP